MVLRRLSVVVLFALALAACGSDGLSKEEFIAEGDQICRETNQAKIADPQSPEEVSPYLDKVIALLLDVRTKFTDLDAPDDGKDVKRALLASLNETIDRIRDARDAAARQDEAAFDSAMKHVNEVSQRADPEANAYGFKVCGSEDELPDS